MTKLFFVFLPYLLLLSANFIAVSQVDLRLRCYFSTFFFVMITGGIYCNGYGEPNPEPHFLEACFLCQKSLGHNTDIFMYRGNTPFCSKECRQEQIEMEEAKEKNWRSSSASTKAPRKSASNKKTVGTGTVAVA